MADEYAAEDELLPAFNRLNTPTFGELQRAQRGNGFARLGSAIGGAAFGGGARDLRVNQIFQQAATGSARTADILLQANQRRDAEIGRRAAAKEFFDKGDMARGYATLNSDNSDQAGKAIAEIDKMQALGELSTSAQGIGYTPELGNAFQTISRASGGASMQGNVEAMGRLAIPAAGTAPVKFDRAQLGAIIKPDSTGVEGGLILDKNAPPTQPLIQTPEGVARVNEITQLGGEHAAQARSADALAAKRALPGTDVNGVPITPPALGDAFNVDQPQGNEYLATLDPNDASVVKALLAGNVQLPAGAMRSPYWQKLLGEATRVDPDFHAFDYNKRMQAAKAFTSGKQGDTIRQINQTISHFGTLADEVAGLGNYNGIQTPLNVVKNTYQNITGDPRQGKFKQDVQAVSSELRKVFSVTGGGSLEELRQWEQSLPLNASQQQQRAYIENGLHLLQGAIDAVQTQKVQSFGKTVGEESVVSPQARATLDRLSNKSAMPPEGTTKIVKGVRYTVKDGHWDDGR